MAGCYSGSESDEEPLNRGLFARKSFAFQGFSPEREDTLKKIVQQIGAVCDNFPKYVFTTAEHFNSLTECNTALYNVSYIRDCVDANRSLSVEPYRFGPKYVERKEFTHFDPCCNNFHNGQEACIVCDPSLIVKEEIPVKQKKKVKEKTNQTSESKTTTVKSPDKVTTVKNSVKDTANKNSVATAKKNSVATANKNSEAIIKSTQRRGIVWEQWENRLILDYIICNNLLMWIKSPSLYKRIKAEGFLPHRTPEPMRQHVTTVILASLNTYNLPPGVLRKLKRIQRSEFPGRVANKVVTQKRKILKKKQMEMSKKSSNNKAL